MSDAPTSQEAGPSSLKTPVMDQSEWASASTPSRQAFPRRLSLLQNDGPSSSPMRSPVTAASDTPRRGKRTSISYISSPSTSIKTEDPQSAGGSSRTRTGSISRAHSLRRRPSQASQSANSDAPDDWLMSEEDASFSYLAAARAMGERDSAKVEAQFQDTGYREGITAGKMSTLQNGFDRGFNEVGALLGRKVGLLRGQIGALLLLSSPTPRLDASSSTSTTGSTFRRTRTAASTTAALPLLFNPRLEEAKLELRSLAKELDALSLDKLAEPDYEALEHEREHAAEDGAQGEAAAMVKRETEEEKHAREVILERLAQRLDGTHARRTPGSSDSDALLTTQTRELLRQIAEKERRCFELRDELATQESALAHLRATFQRMATKDLAYSTSPTLHRHTTSTSSSTSRPSLSNDATEAWNTISSKIPGSLKNQINNLFESITLVDATPAPIEKDSPQLAAKGEESMGMLRPSAGLAVLEEEGSDVASAAALSLRSPLSPAVTNVELAASRDREHLAVQVASRSLARAQSESDSNALGFSVDENGIATPPPPARNNTSSSGSGSGSSWTSRRASVLGSLSSLSKQVESSSDSLGGGLASMFAKRLKEARDGASEMLKEAERKLGNAMTMDDFLGVGAGGDKEQQPRIRLEGQSVDDDGWVEAAGGRSRRGSSAKSSPNLSPVDKKVKRRGSGSSRSSLNLPPSAGGKHGSSRKNSVEEKRDSWSWNAKEEEDEDEWQVKTPKVQMA